MNRLWLLIVLVNFLPAILSDKPGRCPRIVQSSSSCPPGMQHQCDVDADCSGDSKCCSTGCSRVCVFPLYNACDQQKLAVERRARMLTEVGFGESNLLSPSCTDDGKFEEVQCDDVSGICWCVNRAGFERAGTRARSFNLVNCSNPAPCADLRCRMLCEYGFELDPDGCPLCVCRDPCNGVVCPNQLSCQLEHIKCLEEPCPPVPTCKQARSLSSLCPVGEPLMMDSSHMKPFLCGTDPGKPPCPPLHKCSVQPGNEYGVCCSVAGHYQKPGSCPVPGHTDICGSSCEVDLQCLGPDKCCQNEDCGGGHCVAPVQTTECLQQKHLSELLLSQQKSGSGYIPQCDSDGNYIPRQCSRNGAVCWCVQEDGRKISGKMGRPEDVICEEEDLNVATARMACGSQQCPHLCEYGYQLDDNGCPTCHCEDPCGGYHCPMGQYCVTMTAQDECNGYICPTYPQCRPSESPVNPCNVGSPLLDPLNDQVVSCSGPEGCPSSHSCLREESVCCPKEISTGELLPQKSGLCPLLPVESCNGTSIQCYRDNDCGGEMKCCKVEGCGSVCAGPLLTGFEVFNDHDYLPTMCEYLRDYRTDNMAVPVPQCGEDGGFLPVQCDDVTGECWCVDEFGVEIGGSRSRESPTSCVQVRQDVDCLDVVCRLGCDYGFVHDPDTGCPLCECRDPCSSATCPNGHYCDMVDVDCGYEMCPPVPLCLPADRSLDVCIYGEPLIEDLTGNIVSCSPRSRVLECPLSHTCVQFEEHRGVCCPTEHNSEASSLSSLQKFGQCPYLVPISSNTCDYSCSTDEDCRDSQKCCTNGCGTYCTDPLLMTECQHRKSLSEHQSRERNIPPGQMYIPQCDNLGRYELVQCDPRSNSCWCVDYEGREVEGTRVVGGGHVQCNTPRICPAVDCLTHCPYGHSMTPDGCPTCDCHDPCDDVRCEHGMECRMTKVNCISEPCQEMPVCQRRLDALCDLGSPLLNQTTGHQVTCGPQADLCPSTHFCHISPFGEFSVCCLKPYEVCLEKPDLGPCDGSYRRWSFNTETNQCESLMFGGCGGNQNNFLTKEDCKEICPVLTPCQELRINNERHASQYGHVTFIPSCDPVTGGWETLQCQEEVGICWCVDIDGNNIPGTIQRGGQHRCGGRSARKMGFDEKVCPDGVTVHLCNRSLCDHQVCLSHPEARCQVDPCGGCRTVFYDRNNQEVDCSERLGPCRSRVQEVLNSRAWINQGASNDIDGRHPHVSFNSDVFQYHDDGEMFDYRSMGVKPGLCPAPQLPSLLEILTRDCDDSCLSDPDCPASMKCCVTDCGLGCTAPVVVSQHLIPRPGQCPPLPPPSVASQDCSGRQECMFDTDCPRMEKCCFIGCGSVCLHAIDDTFLPSRMSVILPQCSPDGGFLPEQRDGDLSWCVNQQGEPQHHTLTKGTVRCDQRGHLVERRTEAPICPGSTQEPEVCDRACMNASCGNHPDSVCVADPCNNCKVTFYSHSGEEIDCSPPCEQPQLRGMCRAAFPRYFYNSTSLQCEEFIYGGCGGNDNNFNSMEDCESTCSIPVDVCSLPKKVGICRARLHRWFYNQLTHSCEEFVFGGCGGNGNNFETKGDCERKCPDSVVCPLVKPFSFLEMCSRSVACSSRPCPARPDAHCNVDPCTCLPTYTDDDGEIVDCSAPQQETTPAITAAVRESTEDTEPDLSQIVRVEVDAPPPPSSSVETSSVVSVETPRPLSSRCLLLQQQSMQLDAQYVPECDDNGRFTPAQCYQSDPNSPKVCWCVDDAGNQLVGTNSFRQGEKKCDFVPIKSVSVTVGFPSKTSLPTPDVVTVRRHMEQLLEQMSAVTENSVAVDLQPDSTQVKFTLLGENKLDVSYHLEEMIKENHLELEIGDSRIPADLRASWFHHEVDINTNTPPGIREIVVEAGEVEAPYVAATVVFLVLAVVVVCALIVGVVLYRKRTTGRYPKGSLPFSSPALGYEERRFTLQKHYDMIHQQNMDKYHLASK